MTSLTAACFSQPDGGSAVEADRRWPGWARRICAGAGAGRDNSGRHEQRHLCAGARCSGVEAARDTIANTLVKTANETVRGTHVNVEKQVKEQPHEMDGRVFALDLSGDAWLASTAGGLFTSKDNGATWQGGPVMGVTGYLSVTAHGSLMAAARPDGVVLSQDGGQSWWPLGIPTVLTRIHRGGIFAGRHALAGGARGCLLHARQGQDLDVGAPVAAGGCGRPLLRSCSSTRCWSVRGAAILSMPSMQRRWTGNGGKPDTGCQRYAPRGGGCLAASIDEGVLVEPQAAGPELGLKVMRLTRTSVSLRDAA